MKNRTKRRRAKEKERATVAAHRHPLLDGGPEGIWVPLGRTEEPVPLPPHGKLLLVSLKLKRLVWAPLRLWASTPPPSPPQFQKCSPPSFRERRQCRTTLSFWSRSDEKVAPFT